MKYQVYADTRHDSQHAGLITACTHARCSAGDRPGVLYEVEYDGRQVYRAEVRGGKLKAWMR